MSLIRPRFALLAAVVAAAAGLAGCSADDDGEAAKTVTVTAPAAPDAAAASEPAAADDARADEERARQEPDAAEAVKPARPDNDGIPLATPRGAYPLVWVRVHEQVRLRTEPGGGELVATVDRHTQWGSISAFGVVKQSGDWAGVTTPLLPNGQLAWIRMHPDRVRGGWTKIAVVVDLSERRGALMRDGDPTLSFPVTVGMPGAETPTGRFSVTDTFAGDLNPAYGCCALALSTTQPNLPSGWLGGRRIAIHGTSGELGVAASHGCVRASDDTVSELVQHVPLGAPVFIRA